MRRSFHAPTVSPSVPSAFDRVRNPEHTGDNRCLPCTAVNIALAAVAAVAVGSVRPLAGIAVFLVAAAAIAVRGYLVPRTPMLTKRYLPERVLAWFGKTQPTDASPEETEPSQREPPDDLDPEQFLVEHGIVQPCERGDDLCLSDDIADRWHSTAADIDSDLPDGAAARLVDADPESASTVQGRNGFYLDIGDTRYRWVSCGALVADVAGNRVLTDRLAGWTSVPLVHRLTVLRGLRTFLEACPLCGGDVRFGTETVESCCRSTEVVAVTCEDCTERFMELDV